jgi:hypothetical protein
MSAVSVLSGPTLLFTFRTRHLSATTTVLEARTRFSNALYVSDCSFDTNYLTRSPRIWRVAGASSRVPLELNIPPKGAPAHFGVPSRLSERTTLF